MSYDASLNESRSRVVIMHAAHAAIVCLILFKTALHPGDAVMFAIEKRVRELKG